jgi:hypothetical protein
MVVGATAMGLVAFHLFVKIAIAIRSIQRQGYRDKPMMHARLHSFVRSAIWRSLGALLLGCVSTTPLAISGERDHALPSGPLFVPDAWISHDSVREMGLALLRNQTNLELPDWHEGMGPIYVGVNPCTHLQVQDIVRCAFMLSVVPRPGS